MAVDRWPLGNGITDARALIAAALILAFMVAWDIGAGFARRMRPPKPPTREIIASRLLPIVIFAFLTAAYELYRIGGVGVLFTSRAQLGDAIGSDSSTSATAVIHSALLGLPLFIAAYLRIAARKTDKFRPDPILTLSVAATALVLINPISSARYTFGTVAIGLALITLLPMRVVVYRALMLGISSTIVFAFQVFSRYRFDDSRVSATIRLDVPYAQLRHGDYDAFQQVAHAVEWVQATGLHPQQLLGPPLFWVPRVWWPDKPYTDTGILLAMFKGFHFTNLSAPIPAEKSDVSGGPVLLSLSAGF